MDAALDFFAVLGIAAVLWRAVRAAFGATRQGVAAYLAGQIAETRAQRGDLTGMSEASEEAALARRTRWRALRRASFWTALLVLPPLIVSTPALIYAVYALLWLTPRGLERRTDIAPRRS